MPDWTKSMSQSYEYYIVDPNTWKDIKLLDTVKNCNISWDPTTETLGSATIDITGSITECYIRVYLVTIQNGIKERFPLGTFLVQSPSTTFTGSIREVTLDAYTPLLELKEKPTPLGYSIRKGENIMDLAYKLTAENMRGPVVKATSSDKLYYDFVANTDDTWVSFITDLIANAKFRLSLDELGRVLFEPKQDTASLQPVWTYDDDNSSILYPDLSIDHDLYGIPNVLEVLYANGKDYHYARVVNDDPNSPTSTVRRGREILHRDTQPSLAGIPTEDMIKEYAEQLLREMSTIEYTVSYTHGYCPVRVGDCVRFNYEGAGLTDVKARVISQDIKCQPGCPVSEKAIITTKLWG